MTYSTPLTSRILPRSTVVFTALSVLFISSAFSLTAFAHSKGACVNNVVDACNAAHPSNYNARIACTNNGITACNSHSHGGGNGVDSASNDYSAGTSGPDAATRIKRFKKFRIRR